MRKVSLPTQPAAPVRPPAPAPAWLRPVVLALTALLLMAMFSRAVGDSDTWWHLKTGQYILQHHKLPVPDPFAYTTYNGPPAYPGEDVTRYFNLTHEWLAQVFLYGTYALAGFPGLVLMRAAWLTLFCGLAGWIGYRRTRRFYGAVGAALTAALVVGHFATDRPQYLTYVFLALTIAILDSRRRLWLLPPLFLIWANCHGGFFLGWVALGAWCGEAVYLRWRGTPVADERRLWTVSGLAFLASGLNPNFFRVVQVMWYYRHSPMQSGIWEWQPPKFWEASPFTVLLYGALGLMLWNRGKTRPVDWLLLIAFGAAGLTAYRNIAVAALVCAFLVVSYLPEWNGAANWRNWAPAAVLAVFGAYAAKASLPLWAALPWLAVAYLLWKYDWPRVAEGAAAVALAGTLLSVVPVNHAFQLQAATWKVPEAAADFILQHHLSGRIYNTYNQGGYLIWRLWPHLQVFVDGRALNEKVYDDGNRIAMNAAGGGGGKSGDELMREYGIDIIVMDGFQAITGSPYYLPAALADPHQTEWKLVYRDVHEVIYMRHPPPDVPVLNSYDALAGMEEQCDFNIQQGEPACSKGLRDLFALIGDRARTRKWAAVYNEHEVNPGFTVVK